MEKKHAGRNQTSMERNTGRVLGERGRTIHMEGRGMNTESGKEYKLMVLKEGKTLSLSFTNILNLLQHLHSHKLIYNVIFHFFPLSKSDFWHSEYGMIDIVTVICGIATQ